MLLTKILSFTPILPNRSFEQNNLWCQKSGHLSTI